MKYADLRDVFERFHLGDSASSSYLGKISKANLVCAIGMWQRGGSTTDCPHIDNRAESVMIAQWGLSC